MESYTLTLKHKFWALGFWSFRGLQGQEIWGKRRLPRRLLGSGRIRVRRILLRGCATVTCDQHMTVEWPASGRDRLEERPCPGDDGSPQEEGKSARAGLRAGMR